MIRNKYLLAALLAAAPFASHAETDYTFASVSGIKHRGGTTFLTGVQVNDSTATTVSFPSGSTPDRCDALYSEMLRQPGVYTLTVTTDFVEDWYPSGPVQRLVFVGCSLDLKP